MYLSVPILSFMSLPGGMEWIIILIIGLLLFGKRLPEVGKSLGKGIVEFKKGLKGIEDDVNQSADDNQKDMLPPPNNQQQSSNRANDRETTR